MVLPKPLRGVGNERAGRGDYLVMVTPFFLSLSLQTFVLWLTSKNGDKSIIVPRKTPSDIAQH